MWARVKRSPRLNRPLPARARFLGLHGLPLQQARQQTAVYFHRFVLLFAHSFSPLRFVGELEVEHAFVEGLEEAGELELEQAYVDFLLSRRSTSAPA